MIVDDLKVGDTFRDRQKSQVRVESTSRDEESVTCLLKRFGESMPGTKYKYDYAITPDGKIDMADCTEFVSK
jgi:hypothetical protein